MILGHYRLSNKHKINHNSSPTACYLFRLNLLRLNSQTIQATTNQLLNSRGWGKVAYHRIICVSQTINEMWTVAIPNLNFHKNYPTLGARGFFFPLAWSIRYRATIIFRLSVLTARSSRKKNRTSGTQGKTIHIQTFKTQIKQENGLNPGVTVLLRTPITQMIFFSRCTNQTVYFIEKTGITDTTGESNRNLNTHRSLTKIRRQKFEADVPIQLPPLHWCHCRNLSSKEA